MKNIATLRVPQRIIVYLLLVALEHALGNIPPSFAQDANAVARIQSATVYLMQTYSAGNTQALSCVGSGTLISSNGLILTNAHLALPLGVCHGEKVIVALSINPDEPPVPTYIAEPVQYSLDYDLAVMKITGGLDGRPIGNVNLPFVSLGDPTSITINTPLQLIGYPGTGELPVHSEARNVIGFTSGKTGGSQAWLRFDPPIPGTMSGGGAYDNLGNQIGILVGAPSNLANDPGCIPLQDTSGDSLISEADTCVPVASPISALRSIATALPLIEAAKNNFTASTTASSPTPQTLNSPTVTRSFVAEQVDEIGTPDHIASQFPTGTQNLFFFFDFSNMYPGLSYELKTTIDGVESPQLSLGPLTWGNESQGNWYIGVENVSLPDGTYSFSLFVAGQQVATNGAVIGGIPNQPTIRQLRLHIPRKSNNSDIGIGLLPSGITQIDAAFAYSNMPDQQDWTEVWYLDRIEVFRVTQLWDQPSSGVTSVSATNLNGLPPGIYRLDLFIGRNLAATGEVALAGVPGPNGEPAIFSNIRIANDRTREGLPAGQNGQLLPLGTRRIIAFMDWDIIPANMQWTYRWYLDGRLITSTTQGWTAGGSGQNLWVELASDIPLPEGVYAIEILVTSRPIFSSTVSIGSGTRPISGQSSTNDSLDISGKVVDALTGRGISNAQIIVLDVALESVDFSWNTSEIYSQATTDQVGKFTLSKGLPKGNYYTVYVFADGYITIVEDNFTVLTSQLSPVDILIQMNRP